MTEQIALEPIDGIEIQTLVDNQWDMLLQSNDRAKRPPMSAAGRPMVEAPLFVDPHLPEYLIAEHGFSALVSVMKGGSNFLRSFSAPNEYLPNSANGWSSTVILMSPSTVRPDAGVY